MSSGEGVIQGYEGAALVNEKRHPNSSYRQFAAMKNLCCGIRDELTCPA